MNQVTLHGKPIKVGDKVWEFKIGWTTVKKIRIDGEHPIVVDRGSYDMDGKEYLSNKHSSLFWQEQTFDLSKPLPKLDVDDKVIVWRIEDNKHYRHFCRFDSNGNIVTFDDGKTSWTGNNSYTSAWASWELPNK